MTETTTRVFHYEGARSLFAGSEGSEEDPTAGFTQEPSCVAPDSGSALLFSPLMDNKSFTTVPPTLTTVFDVMVAPMDVHEQPRFEGYAEVSLFAGPASPAYTSHYEAPMECDTTQASEVVFDDAYDVQALRPECGVTYSRTMSEVAEDGNESECESTHFHSSRPATPRPTVGGKVRPDWAAMSNSVGASSSATPDMKYEASPLNTTEELDSVSERIDADSADESAADPCEDEDDSDYTDKGYKKRTKNKCGRRVRVKLEYTTPVKASPPRANRAPKIAPGSRPGPPAYDAEGVATFQTRKPYFLALLEETAAGLGLPSNHPDVEANRRGIAFCMNVQGSLHGCCRASARSWQGPEYVPGTDLSQAGAVKACCVRYGQVGEPYIHGLLQCADDGCCIGTTHHHSMSCTARLLASMDLIFESRRFMARFSSNRDKNRAWCPNMHTPELTFSKEELLSLPHALVLRVRVGGIFAPSMDTPGQEVRVWVCASGCFVTWHFGGADGRDPGAQMADHVRVEHGQPGPMPAGQVPAAVTRDKKKGALEVRKASKGRAPGRGRTSRAADDEDWEDRQAVKPRKPTARARHYAAAH